MMSFLRSFLFADLWSVLTLRRRDFMGTIPIEATKVPPKHIDLAGHNAPKKTNDCSYLFMADVLSLRDLQPVDHHKM